MMKQLGRCKVSCGSRGPPFLERHRSHKNNAVSAAQLQRVLAVPA